MRGRSRSRSGNEPGVKVDARSERWREHRKKVRSEIVDAAFRAIDRLGPELSLREIAEEAGTAKPKIYRHFTDKSDLFQAIGERLRDMLWAAIFPSINVATDPAREVIRRSVEQYVRPGRRAPERGALPDAGPLRRAERVRDAGAQRGARHHARDGRHVQQRAARDGARRRGDRTCGVRDIRHRGVGDRLVAGDRTRTARAGCRPTSSSRT